MSRLKLVAGTDGETFQVIFVPLIDIDGRNLGNVVVVKDISQILQLSRQSMITTSTISILIGGALILVFYGFLGKVEKNIADRNAELTEAKIKKVELEQSKKAADAASEAKSEFLANMSHELRTPLNGILGYAQILRRTERLTKKGHKGVEIIQQCGHHLLTLINDVLDLSKIEARKLELNSSDFYLPSFLEGVTEICRVRAEQKNIGFNVELDANLPDAVHADEKRLRQVLINLIGNAIKFTHKGSVTLLVKTQPVTSEGSPSPIHRFRFEVIDTGVGMTAEDLQKIFQPFEQVGDRKQQIDQSGQDYAIGPLAHAAWLDLPLWFDVGVIPATVRSTNRRSPPLAIRAALNLTRVPLPKGACSQPLAIKYQLPLF